MKAHAMKGLLTTLLVLALSMPAAALNPVSVEGLNVTLYCDPLMSTVTDASGAFTFEGVPAGIFAVGVSDMGYISALFQFEVTAEQAPAKASGQVIAFSGPDFGFTVSIQVVTDTPPPPPPPPPGSSASVTGVSVNPKKWNANYVRSNGKVTVRIAGTGLESIQQVTLVNPALAPAGTISTTSIVFDPIEGTAAAKFGKAPAFGALVPPGSPRGTVVPIQVVVTYPGGSATFDKKIVILGKIR